MSKAYRVLANIIAIEVVLQAMFMVFAISGLFKWIDDGATLDKGVVESWDADPPTWEGAVGYFLHVVNGQFLIPLIGLALLIISFFAKVSGGTKLAVVIFVSIIVQVAAGMLGESAPLLGLVHGLNAFILFMAALMASKAAKEQLSAEPVAA